MSMFASGYSLVALSAIFVTTSAPAAPPKSLSNDTGRTTCYVSGALTDKCAGTGQDAEFGRDFAEPRSNNGVAGFSFAKLDALGNLLPKTASAWACIRDNVTGLIWENKTSDGGPHNGTTAYGLIQTPGSTAVPVSQLLDFTNKEKLCGQPAWRVPTREELVGIINYAAYPSDIIAIDIRWFLNTHVNAYWTSSKYTPEIDYYWPMSLVDGTSLPPNLGSNAHLVRLVTGGSTDQMQRFTTSGEEVTDSKTGLIWRRCTEGKTLASNHCSGKATRYTWQTALNHANDVARSTGVKWRVPNAKELNSIVDLTKVKPSIDTKVFPETPNLWYRTSTVYGNLDRPTPLPAPVAAIGVVEISFQKGEINVFNTPTNEIPGALRLVRDPG